MNCSAASAPAQLQVPVPDAVFPAGPQNLQALTSKPVLYVANVDEGEDEPPAALVEHAREGGDRAIALSAKIEAELAELFIVADVRTGEDVTVTRTERHKCGRCWRHLPEVTVDGALCDRCAGVVA